MLWVQEPQEDLYYIKESEQGEDGLEKKNFCILSFKLFLSSFEILK